MAIFKKTEKIFTKKNVTTYAMIILGSALLAAGFNFFITPHRIVPGGVYGLGIVANFLTEGLFPRMGMPNGGFPVGTAGLLFDIPITILAIITLGPNFGLKTIFGMFTCTFFLDYAGVPVTALAPNDPLISAIFGGVLIGAGVGCFFNVNAGSGGSDSIAMILNKYTHLPLGFLIIIIDSLIVLVGLIVFRDWTIPLYSWVTIFVTGKVIDLMVEGFYRKKALFVNSNKFEEISKFILEDLGRGGTMFKGKGMYTNDEKKIIFTVLNRKEMVKLKQAIHQIDPNAFITIMETSEIFGEGFKQLKN